MLLYMVRHLHQERAIYGNVISHSIRHLSHLIHLCYSFSIGDDFGRSISYGLWSLLVPVGYNRDPASPMGYSNVKIVPAGLSAVDADNRLHGDNQGTLFVSSYEFKTSLMSVVVGIASL